MLQRLGAGVSGPCWLSFRVDLVCAFFQIWGVSEFLELHFEISFAAKTFPEFHMGILSLQNKANDFKSLGADFWSKVDARQAFSRAVIRGIRFGM